MINETEIYGDTESVFKTIIEMDNVLNTYHVSPDYGSDLNTNNLESYIKDNKYGLVTIQPKYPICVCMPPRSILEGDFETFTFNLFFLKQAEIENIDKDTNVSMQKTIDDWSNMKNSAKLFIANIKTYLKGYYNDNSLWANVFSIQAIDKIQIKRVTKANVDKISGVGITFNAVLNSNFC